jgi:hypothetical protein
MLFLFCLVLCMNASHLGSLPKPVCNADIVVGNWKAEGSGKVRIEFMKTREFSIRIDNELLYRGDYELLGNGEVGLNNIIRGNGRRLNLPYMTGARAAVIIKINHIDECLVLERPRLPEWSLVVGSLRLPPKEGARIKLVRVPNTKPEVKK